MQNTRGSRCVSQRCWKVGMYVGARGREQSRAGMRKITIMAFFEIKLRARVGSGSEWERPAMACLPAIVEYID